jgi:hypothetical protein
VGIEVNKGTTMLGTKVFVYFNLHRKCLSIKALSGPNKGRVIAHASSVILADALFKVSEAGRMRVIQEKRKNVHAGIVGTVQSMDNMADYVKWAYLGNPVKYNPYKFESFVLSKGEQPVYTAALVSVASIDGRGQIYASEN